MDAEMDALRQGRDLWRSVVPKPRVKISSPPTPGPSRLSQTQRPLPHLPTRWDGSAPFPTLSPALSHSRGWCDPASRRSSPESLHAPSVPAG